MKFKITANLNRIPDSYKIEKDFEKAGAYLYKHGVDISFSLRKVSVVGYTNYHQTIGLDRWLIQGSQNVVNIDYNADMNMFVFDQAEWKNPQGSTFPLKPETPSGSCFMFNGKPFMNVGRYIQPDWVQIAHEIMHGLVYIANAKGLAVKDVMDTYRENADPDSPTGNFAEQWKLLEALLNPKIMYKYFKEKEIIGLKSELVKILDLAREKSGTPYKINSGFRTPERNIAVGGKSNSSHLRGMAVDLDCSTNTKRGMMLEGLLPYRKQLFIEIATKHIHVDIDSSIHQLGDIMVSNDE